MGVLNVQMCNIFPIEQLLQLKVDIPSWNKYIWSSKKMNEEDIALTIFGTLLRFT